MKCIIKSVFIFSCALTLTGCRQSEQVTDEVVNEILISHSNRFETIEKYQDFDEIKDVQTGVHYFIHTNSDVIFPVYESDGTIRAD